jgi:rhodanese-related sulfurtransferase
MASNISSILDGLYIGNYNSSLDEHILKTFNIHVIVNCTENKEKINKKDLNMKCSNKNTIKNLILCDCFACRDIVYHQIHMSDSYEINNLQFLSEKYINIIDTIDKHVQNNKNILIYCDHGAQRSPAIAALYLILKYNVCVQSAIMFIKNNRQLAFFGKVNYLNTLHHAEQYSLNKQTPTKLNNKLNNDQNNYLNIMN